jgi:hypothetical protein
MKQIFFLFICCALVATHLYAQDFAAFGTFGSEEINLKECSFDKEATAVILLHEAYSTYDDEHHLITSHHVKIKILSEKGFSAADISIPFYRKDDFEQIYKTQAATFNIEAGGNIQRTNVAQKSIYTRKTNERIGEVVFAFPAVKVGSILEYRYESMMKHYGGLEGWEFQERLPVVTSRYTLVILPNMEFAYIVNKAPNLPIVIRQEKSLGGVYFEMNDIAGLADEPYMDARKDYLQKVMFQLSGYRHNGDEKKYMTSWNEVIKELLSSVEFGAQLNKKIAGTDAFIDQVKTLSAPEEKMTAVYEFVRSNMKWNDLYSKYAYQGVKDAWQKKSGTSGDINLLMVNLMQNAGLDAYPMLVSERFHGKVDSNYPFIDQFNSVFACVIINEKKYFLDATDKLSPAYLTPFDILNTTAFIVNRKAGGLINISTDTAEYKEQIVAMLEVSKEGILSGDISIKSSEYARVKKMANYFNTKDRNEDTHLLMEGADFTVTAKKFNNVKQDSLSLEQECKISGALNVAGEFSFVPLNFFTGFDTNPFLSENRFSNINFGYKRKIMMNLVVQLPPNYTVDEVPKLVKLTNEDKDIFFERSVEYNKTKNSVNAIVQIDFRKSLYETEMYSAIQQIYQRIAQSLKESLVIKKKP